MRTVGNLNRLRNIGNSHNLPCLNVRESKNGCTRSFLSRAAVVTPYDGRFRRTSFYRPRLRRYRRFFGPIRMNERKKNFCFFLKLPLASRQEDVIMVFVPPYDCFGDWATPKEPAAELFLRPVFPHFLCDYDLPFSRWPALSAKKAIPMPIARC